MLEKEGPETPLLDRSDAAVKELSSGAFSIVDVSGRQKIMLRQLSLTGQILNAFCSAAKPPSSARYGGVPFTSDKSSYQSQSARPSDLVGVIPVQPISVHQSGGCSVD
jgi:hypothetical protein